jgi:hypothetical protein
LWGRKKLATTPKTEGDTRRKQGVFMLAPAAMVFGIVFLVVGVLGFIPAVAPNEMLLGIFHVNAAHNAVHLLSGAVALACGFAGAGAARLYFRIFGIVYGLVAVLGFIQGDTHLLGLISNNTADAWLHAGIAVVSLALGFGVRNETAPARPV